MKSPAKLFDHLQPTLCKHGDLIYAGGQWGIAVGTCVQTSQSFYRTRCEVYIPWVRGGYRLWEEFTFPEKRNATLISGKTAAVLRPRSRDTIPLVDKWLRDNGMPDLARGKVLTQLELRCLWK